MAVEGWMDGWMDGGMGMVVMIWLFPCKGAWTGGVNLKVGI